MISIESIDDIVVNGGLVFASDGAKIGSVEQVFLSEDSGDPAFVTVRTGLFGMSESFVPLAGATIDGQRIRVAYDKSTIRNGPRIESDRGSITADEENELYRYYGVDGDDDRTDDRTDNRTDGSDATEPGSPPRPGYLPPPPHAHAPGHHPPPPRPRGPAHSLPPHLLKHDVGGHPHHPPPPVHPPRPH